MLVIWMYGDVEIILLVAVTPSFRDKPEMASLLVFPIRGRPEMTSWCNTNLGWKPGGGVVSRGATTANLGQAGSGRRNGTRDLLL
jgi:hypothetical protein